MKLVRYGSVGKERPGLIDTNGDLRDLSDHVDDIGGDTLGKAALKKLAALDQSSLPRIDAAQRFGPCVGQIGKFICIGLNYARHAKETGAEPPSEPVVFMKATSAVCGPNDTVLIPARSKKADWEVELGVVIGTHTKNVSEENALSHVAGYCVVNDLSEREFQLERGGQWVKGKSLDTFGPLGPWLVTRDEIPDPQSLNLWLDIDGHRYQDSSTSDMIFSVAEIISHLSAFMSLQPGDVISTGTPEGVGMGQRPEPIYLKPGQEMRLGIEGLGEQCQQTGVAD